MSSQMSNEFKNWKGLNSGGTQIICSFSFYFGIRIGWYNKALRMSLLFDGLNERGQFRFDTSRVVIGTCSDELRPNEGRMGMRCRIVWRNGQRWPTVADLGLGVVVANWICCCCFCCCYEFNNF